MIILIGASASGKTEVVKYLEEHMNYKKLVTYTTREMRPGEVNHKDYHFIDRETFERYLDENKFFEYVEYNSNLYGTLREDITDDKVVILEPNGYKAYHYSEFKNLVSFFLDASDENRRARMEKRGDEEKKILKRLESDKTVFDLDSIAPVDYVINSNSLDIEQMSVSIDDLYKNKLTC